LNPGVLNVGETWTYTYSHSLTQAELNTKGVDGDGTLDNTASVDTDQTDPQSATASVDLVYNPKLEITKTAVVADWPAPGFVDTILS